MIIRIDDHTLNWSGSLTLDSLQIFDYEAYRVSIALPLIFKEIL
jgi:hypothetical protein